MLRSLTVECLHRCSGSEAHVQPPGEGGILYLATLPTTLTVSSAIVAHPDSASAVFLVFSPNIVREIVSYSDGACDYTMLNSERQ